MRSPAESDQHDRYREWLEEDVSGRGARRVFGALAVEHGATWVTIDRGFARFPGLRFERTFDN